MNTSLQHNTALVLGGGGSAGNAWLIGVIAGLVEAGLDVTRADLIIGTSAGATAAAQITGASPAQLLADTLTAAAPHQPGSPGAVGRPPAASASDYLRRITDLIAASDGLKDMRRRMGAAALELDASSDLSAQSRWRATVAARLPIQYWPEQAIQITVVNAATGEPVVLDRDSGVELVDAVAASCAGGFAYNIGGIPYIDGGYRRSSENADLAGGYGRVLVLSPLGGRALHPAAWGSELAVQADELRAGGSTVEAILPDSASLEAFGDNMMDPSRRPTAARAGYHQGKALAEQLMWRSYP